MTEAELSLGFEFWLKLAAHQHLNFHISRNVRCIFMEFKDGELRYRAYFEREPSDEDCELISDALSETATSFVEVKSDLFECLMSSQNFAELDKLDYWLFVRAEELGDE